MVNRLRPLNVFDFTGGLNLRPESFQLAENELPEVLNMELDPRGGIYTRKGWERWNTADVTADAWNPRAAYLHELAAGTQYVMVANNAKLFSASAGTFAQITGVTLGASPHLVDFASWGDTLYLACGRTQQSAKTTGTGAGTLLTSNGPTWQDDYLTPVGSYMPRAEVATAHQGYMFVANTRENSVDFLNRLRWSHPNSPENWHSTDYLDVLDGGSRITGLFSFGDRLIIFKPDSVWALYGYDADSWNLVNLTRSVGAVSQQAIARSENALFFMSWPKGVYLYDGGDIKEVSTQLRTFFDSNDLTLSDTDNVWMGWMDRRLWVTVPYDSANPDTIFVLDPSLNKGGAWTMFRGADDYGLGPFVEKAHAGADAPDLAFARVAKVAMRINAAELSQDDFDGSPDGFTSHLRTRWLDAGMPTARKSWRSPDYLLRQVEAELTLSGTLYTNYDAVTAERSFELSASPTAEAVYGDFDWGDGTLFSSGGSGAVKVRGSTLGLADAIQLKLAAPAGSRWGLNVIVTKFVPKRFR
jgi:hypothetical protein